MSCQYLMQRLVPFCVASATCVYCERDSLRAQLDDMQEHHASLVADAMAARAQLATVVEALRGHAWRTVADAGFVSETLAELAKEGT